MRIRSIKPQFWANETLAELSHRTRLLFIGLWNLADRRGRLEDRPKRIRVEVFPYEVEPVESELATLAEKGFIVRYERDGFNLIQVSNFERHQRITGKEAEHESEFPGPYRGNTWETPGKRTGAHQEATVNAPGESQQLPGESPETHPGAQEGKGKEGNRKGKDIGNGVPPVAPQGGPGTPVEKNGEPEGQPSLLPPDDQGEGTGKPPAKGEGRKVGGGALADPTAKVRATQILDHLVKVTGRKFMATKSCLTEIACRLREVDWDMPGVIRMIDDRWAKWGDDLKMQEFVRPDTLFAKTNFPKYYVEAQPRIAPPTSSGIPDAQDGPPPDDDDLAILRGAV